MIATIFLHLVICALFNSGLKMANINLSKKYIHCNNNNNNKIIIGIYGLTNNISCTTYAAKFYLN